MLDVPYSPARALLQSSTLKALARVPRVPRQIPLFFPPVTLHTGGGTLSHIFDEVFCTRTYLSPKPLPPSPVIVDAGAHAGLASMAFLVRYPGSSLTSIEPNPNLCPLLRSNLGPWEHRVTIHEAALSAEDGTATFHVTRENPYNVTGGLEVRDRQHDTESFEVRCIAAERILPAHVDLMKLDVEGHEYVLLKLDVFRPERVDNLIVEFHDIEERGSTFMDTISLLRDRGYRVADQEDRQMDLASLSALRGSSVLKLY